MKIRFFLRGLGAGIILTALILCVGYRVNAPEQNIVEEARKLGMVFPEGTSVPTGTASRQQGDTSPGDTSQGEISPVETSSGKIPSGKTSASMSAAPAETSNSAGVKKGQSAKVQGTRFTVRGGLLSSSVAREMMEAGIIKSDKVLDDLLEKNGYAREIQAGTYFIPAGSTYEEIAKIITGRQ